MTLTVLLEAKLRLVAPRPQVAKWPATGLTFAPTKSRRPASLAKEDIILDTRLYPTA